ncbi:hypothetical protein Malapachy_2206 [Malassezia pachydermatis]|uniref:Uncharacterized protein n=1 Tax=Malassezia pachydermatis TaxID=77020 RepID=A0A0M8MSB2_9BASI|nr:hypothetical protein Malapachy_2206 [Malassezia pachydermatis]KOS15767.1 hypothetical protein Malapachy_2206 [Malassezia pachydermatis]
MISREAVIAISLALRKRGGVYYLATKFPAYLETISQYLQDTSMPWFALEGDTTTEAAPRSVRTL